MLIVVGGKTMKKKKKVIAHPRICIFIVFSLVLSGTIQVVNADSEQTLYKSDNYEELFENKEEIHIIPSNNIRTQLLTLSRKAWELRTYIFQKRTVKPVEDEDSDIFSYWAKPVFQIGLPDQRFATQITPEGHLFTGSAELEFFAGENLDPINQRIWTLYKGYLPCINYAIEKDGLIFKIQAFQYWLDRKYDSSPINFIKVQIINPTEICKKTRFGIGFKYGGIDHRDPSMFLNNSFNPLWKYEMTDDYAVRDKKLIYLWDTNPSEKSRFFGRTYHNPFYCLSNQKTVSLSSYDLQLEGNEIINYTFKMPHYPLDINDKNNLDLLENAVYDDYLMKMQVFWDDLIEQGSIIRVPEDKVINASKSYIIHCFMCQNNVSDDQIEQMVNRFQYNQFWVSCSYYTTNMYNFYNYPDVSQKLLSYVKNFQDESGEIISQPGYWKQICNAVAAFGEYIRVTNDTVFAEEILPVVIKAVDWLKEKILQDCFGLMPFANTKDGPFLVGHYTGHNFWTLLALDGAIRVAHAAGDEQTVKDFEFFYDSYYNHFVRQLRIASERNNGVIPPGMDVKGGLPWEDLLVTYSDCLLSPFDPLVNNTFTYYRENHMKEGIATHGAYLHHWLTDFITQASLRRGEQEYVLNDFYSMLLHTGSCHEGFEYCVYPSTRDYATRAGLPLCALIKTAPYWCNFPCNARYAATFNVILRKMLVREDSNRLHLFSAVSPEWVKSGDVIEVKDAPTYFGMINLSAIATDDGINITFEPIWREKPESVVLHIPFFAEINSVSVNDKEVKLEEDYIELPLIDSEIEITWDIDSTINYSYQKIVEDYLAGKI